MSVPGLPRRTDHASPLRDAARQPIQGFSLPGLTPVSSQPSSSLSSLGQLAARAATSSFAGLQRAPFQPALPQRPPHAVAPTHVLPPLRYTPDGYALSSTAPDPSFSRVERPRWECLNCFPTPFANAQQLILHKSQHVKCDYPDCKYEGIPSALKLHKEDRHLIFDGPPRQAAQPSDEEARMKGKRVAIAGTSIRLDSQEQIDRWIAERKKRFPKQGGADAAPVASTSASPYFAAPRQPRPPESASRGLSYGRGIPQRGRGSERGSPRGRGARGRGRDAAPISVPAPQESAMDKLGAYESVSDGSSSTSDDDAPEEAPTKEVQREEASERPAKRQRATQPARKPTLPTRGARGKALKSQPQRREPVAKASAPVKKDSLMSKLLAIEIEHDMSDLAQVVTFLLNNDCLRDVELKPGDADESRVREMPSS